MKKLAIAAVLVAMGFAYVGGQSFAQQWNAPSAEADVVSAARAFAATGATQESLEVHDWTTLTDGYWPLASLRTSSLRIAKALGMSELQWTQHVSAGEHVALWSGSLASRSWGRGGFPHATVELASMQFAGAPSQTVLIIRVVAGRATLAQALSLYRAVDHAVRVANGNPTVNVTFIGTIPGQMGTSLRRQRIADALHAVHANSWQSVVYPYTTSVAGYIAENIPTLTAGATKWNIQVALHENNVTNTTRVLVGSPVITVEY